MRLGQMSRKLGVSQGEIARYLSEQNLSVEEGSNVKLDESRIRLLYARFAPGEVYPPSPAIEYASAPVVNSESPESERLSGATEATTGAIQSEQNEWVNEQQPSQQSLVQPDMAVSADGVTVIPENPLSGEPEVIRAPKVELAGLKVIGKIELPSPRKKEVSEPDANALIATPSDPSPAEGAVPDSANPIRNEPPRRPDEPRKARDSRRPGDERGPRRKNDREQRAQKNPIAIQREKEMREELERRRAKAAEEKERRTRNYNNRVKHSPPTKAVRLIEEPVEQLDATTIDSEPKTWFGKLIKWLRT